MKKMSNSMVSGKQITNISNAKQRNNLFNDNYNDKVGLFSEKEVLKIN